MQDLIYVWKDQDALKFADNISLPGGFKMGDTGQDYCDVKTATGFSILIQTKYNWCFRGVELSAGGPGVC